jgi:hypothetical protein
MNLYFRPLTPKQAQLQLAVEKCDSAKPKHLIQLEWFVLTTYGSILPVRVASFALCVRPYEQVLSQSCKILQPIVCQGAYPLPHTLVRNDPSGAR